MTAYSQERLLVFVDFGGCEQLPDDGAHARVHASAANHHQHLFFSVLWIPHLSDVLISNRRNQDTTAARQST